MKQNPVEFTLNLQKSDSVKVSIVVPAFNEEKLLKETLTAIRASSMAFTERNWDVELVVCDNNSKDRTADIARENGAVVVFEPINQIARARNKGAEAATGEWLIFVDADSRPSRELFYDVADQIASGKSVAGGCLLRLDEKHWIGNSITFFWNCISRITKWAAGSFIFCEAMAFRAVGGFSNDLYASEELDLFRRLKSFARRERKKIVILSKHPMVTSARKMHLYSFREHMNFFFQAILRYKSTMRDRSSCMPWYDGRR